MHFVTNPTIFMINFAAIMAANGFTVTSSRGPCAPIDIDTGAGRFRVAVTTSNWSAAIAVEMIDGDTPPSAPVVPSGAEDDDEIRRAVEMMEEARATARDATWIFVHNVFDRMAVAA